jgi:hypothetical protein
MKEDILSYTQSIWESEFENELQTFESSFYVFDYEDLVNVNIEYLVGKPEFRKKDDIATSYIHLYYKIIIKNLIVGEELSYHMNDIPESIWDDLLEDIESTYYRMGVPQKAYFHSDFYFDFEDNPKPTPYDRKILVHLLRTFNVNRYIYDIYFTNSEPNTLYLNVDLSKSPFENEEYADEPIKNYIQNLITNKCREYMDTKNFDDLNIKVLYVNSDNEPLHEAIQIFKDNQLPENIKNDVNLMLNVVLKEEYDWFQSIQINEIGGTKQKIVVGVMTVDPTWLYNQYKEFHYSKPIPDVIDFGDISDPVFHSEFMDTINNVISSMVGKNLNIITSFLEMKFGEESED